MSGDTIYFVSDAHFGLYADERVKINRFGELAARMRGEATDLFILGDLFDFWVEYRSAIRADYFQILHRLRGLVDAGVRVHYLTGNHDFAVGEFLEKTLGISILNENFNTPLQGRKVHMRHGDDVTKKSVVSAMLRNKSLQAAYRIIHPTIGIGIGKMFSAMSRQKHRGATLSEKELNIYRSAAQEIINADNRDLVIFAHTHHAELVNLEGGEYCNIGAWMDHYNYATLRDGKIELLKWTNTNSVPY